MNIEIKNGLEGRFKLLYNTNEKSVKVTFEDMENFEEFFYWLEEIKRQQKGGLL